MRDRGELLEYAEVFGNFYGTPRRPVEEALSQGRDVLFDIDWQGTQQLAQAMEDDLVRIFILPPSVDDLRDRLIQRAQDSSAVVAKRMAEAGNEISHWPEYDYVIVNDSIAESGEQISAILTAERLKRRRRIGLTDFVRQLTKEALKASADVVEELRKAREIGDGKILGAQFARNAGICQKRHGIATERFEARAQHLAPLAEGCRRDPLQASPCGSPARMPARGGIERRMK